MIKTKKTARFSIPVKIAVILILLFLVIIPIVRMFALITPESFRSVLENPVFTDALWNSLILSASATLIVILLAYLLALCMTRANPYFKKVFDVILVLPMLIPSISHGMGLIILLGNNGILTRFFNLEQTIYGPFGIVTGSVLYAFPVAYIMLSDVLKYEDLSVYEAANTLGINRVRQFFRISLPYLKKPLIATAFSTFSMIITDYGVPKMIGGSTKTLSLLMFEEAFEFEKGSVYGAFLLIPAIVAFISDALNKERATTAFVHKDAQFKKRGAKDYIALAFCGIISLLTLLPLISFVVLAFAKSYPRDLTPTLQNLMTTFNRHGSTYLFNSLMIALLSAAIGTAFAYMTAYITSRMRSWLARIIHLLTLTFMAIPGMVLGISYVVSFSGTPLYGTLAIMVMVNVAHFVSSPYLMMYNSFGKMNENLEAVGETLGVGKLRMIKDVFIPQNIGTIAEMFSYLFVNCMMTISAVSFLAIANINIKPIALMINQFEDQSQYECIAVVSLMILLVNVLVKVAIGILKTTLGKKKRKAENNI